MEHHPDYELWLYTDADLEERLGSPVRERTALHEWPLSCVQRVDLHDGRRFICKSQLAEATVEPSFYAQARSSLLVKHEELGEHKGTATSILEYLSVPSLKSQALPPEQALEHVLCVAAEVRRIGEDVPVAADISSPATWGTFANQILDTAQALVEARVFRHTSADTIRRLHLWSASKPVTAAVGTGPCLVHGDLHGANVFVLPDGYRVVDWQRPLRGSRGLDEIQAMGDAGLDPLTRFDAQLVAVYWFLRLAWFVQCQARFIPVCNYDEGVADRATRVLAHFTR